MNCTNMGSMSLPVMFSNDMGHMAHLSPGTRTNSTKYHRREGQQSCSCHQLGSRKKRALCSNAWNIGNGIATIMSIGITEPRSKQEDASEKQTTASSEFREQEMTSSVAS
ncbi:Os09g0553150 [Oryza sativa Japonica Group]|uniref:Os09g0553150 protein n=1 Tax=Oryza sativa subsp. japonica TaxID=39947 RepID=A0A0P0XQD0_ORYSJ|nr:Os09g0553150 [Oryza sativa Japonica Group]